jgi:hypothetical protein
VIQHLLSMLRPVPLDKLVSEDLYEAKRDLLAASKNREYWESQERMLMSRVDRLEEEAIGEPGGPSEGLYTPKVDGQWERHSHSRPFDLPVFTEPTADPSFVNSQPGHP